MREPIEVDLKWFCQSRLTDQQTAWNHQSLTQLIAQKSEDI